MADPTRNPFVGIASVIGGISLVIVLMIAILAREQLAVAAWIVGALSAMGALLGHFASRSSGPR